MWLGEGPLLNFLCKEISLTYSFKMVIKYWIQGEDWDWNALEGLLLDHVISKLATFVLSEERDEEDDIC